MTVIEEERRSRIIYIYAYAQRQRFGQGRAKRQLSAISGARGGVCSGWLEGLQAATRGLTTAPRLGEGCSDLARHNFSINPA
jgi:hypothetical protein